MQLMMRQKKCAGNSSFALEFPKSVTQLDQTLYSQQAFKTMYRDRIRLISINAMKSLKCNSSIIHYQPPTEKSALSSSMTVFITLFKRFAKTLDTILYKILQRLMEQ